MNTKIRVLHIDDNLHDRQLVKDALLKEHNSFEVIEADNREKFEQYLAEKDFDIILSDFNILGFNGLQVLQIVKEMQPETPVIIITGTGSEEIAIQAIKMGAADYVIKKVSHIRGLAHTIELVLANKELLIGQKKDQAALQISEEKYRNMFANNPQPMWIYDLETLAFLEVNEAAILHYGYSREKFLSMTIKDIRPPEDVDALLKNIESANIAFNTSIGWRHLKKNGEIIIVQIISQPVTFDHRKARHVMVSDITKRLEAEEQLRQSEEKFRNVFEHSLVGKSLTSMDGTLITNQAFCNILGYSNEELSQMKWQQITNPEDIENDQKMINSIISGENKSAVWEKRYIHKTGRTVWVVISSNLLYDYDKKPLFFITSILDITKRKLAEKELQKLSLAVQQSPNSIVITAIDGTIEYANPITFKLSGYSPEELIGKNPRIFSSGETTKEEYENMWKTILAGNEWEGEFHNKRKNGDFFWELVIISPILDEKGKIIHFLAIKEDITERKKTEQIQRVIFNISNAASITDNLEQLVLQIQKELGTIIDSTNFFLALYDAKSDTISLPYFVDQYDEFKSLPKEGSITGYVIKTQKSLLANLDKIHELEDAGLIGRYGADSLIWLGVPIIIEGLVTGVLALQSYTDANAYNESDQEMMEFIVSQIGMAIHRKNIEQDLILAKEHAEESDRLKSAFLANMSHEIRTPMNGILGFAELLKEPDLTGEQQQDYIRIIEQSGARMLNIINDIVDISKIESGGMKVNITETNINEQLNFIYTFFQPEVDEKEIEFSNKTTLTSNEGILKTDREKVYAVLINLVKNAIKYTQKGSIEFGVSTSSTTGPASEPGSIEQSRNVELLQFFVKDTGIGIPKNRHEAIFERFIQADIVDKMARQGAGLGLAISKAYVEMLGGKIWVESEEGKGSTFYFTIPYLTGLKDEIITGYEVMAPIEESQMKKLKILIAEDDEASSQLISMVTRKFGGEIITVQSGTEAVRACFENPDIDLVLMDIQMPEMDGYEATRQIREFNKNVIIIAQTAYALSGDKEKAIEAGCNDYISKPIKLNTLKELINNYFNK